MRSKGKSIMQLEPSPTIEVQSNEEEVARRGSEEGDIVSSQEEENLNEFTTPLDQGSDFKHTQPHIVEQSKMVETLD